MAVAAAAAPESFGATYPTLKTTAHPKPGLDILFDKTIQRVIAATFTLTCPIPEGGRIGSQSIFSTGGIEHLNIQSDQ